MKIVLKGVPPSCNQFNGRGNVWAYRKAKEEWTRKVYALSRNCPERPKMPLKKALVRIDYFFPDKRRRDEDNYSGKLFMDGLTQAGVIVDDNFWVISKAIHAHLDKANPRTEITVLGLEGL